MNKQLNRIPSTARVVLAGLVLLGPSIAPPVQAAGSDGAVEMLRSMTERVLDALRTEPGLLEQPLRVRALTEELILPNIDFRTASRWVLGRHWRTASPAQRNAFVAEFRELLVGTYTNSLGKYRDYTLRFLSARPGQPAGRAVVDAEVVQPEGPPVGVIFRLHRPGDRWLVYDIVIEGVSLVATQRSGFDNEIRNSGLDSLIARLASLNNGGAAMAGVPAQPSP